MLSGIASGVEVFNNMKPELALKFSYNELKKEYISYLKNQGLSRDTVSTMSTDAFYLWKNAGKDEFWKTVTSENFEEYGRSALTKTLSENSKGNIDNLTNGYLTQIRKFRNFIYSENFNPRIINEEEEIKNFLLDIECLESLSKWSEKFNLFDVLKISRTEIRHSNMLAWLLSPDENHGLGDRILKGFVQYAIKNFSNDKDVFSTLLMDFHDFTVQREWHNIDLIAISEEARFVLCIENKIDSGEHDNQLQRYRGIVEKTYPSYKKIYIFLSPNGIASSEPDYWCPMPYQEVLKILEINMNKSDLSTDIKIFIQNYIEIIRRDILEDEELAKICREIYRKHQKALDLIFENKPDKSSELSDLIKEWCAEKGKENELIFDKEHSSKKYIRFRTKKMDNLIPPSSEPNSGWKTLNHYFYEIVNNDGKEFSIQFVVNSENKSEEQTVIFNRINSISPSKQQKDNWLWRTHFATKHCKIEEEIDEDKITVQLDKLLSEVFDFEEQLIEKLGIQQNFQNR